MGLAAQSFALRVAARFSRSGPRLAFRFAKVLRTVPRGSALLSHHSLQRRNLSSAIILAMILMINRVHIQGT